MLVAIAQRPANRSCGRHPLLALLASMYNYRFSLLRQVNSLRGLDLPSPEQCIFSPQSICRPPGSWLGLTGAAFVSNPEVTQRGPEGSNHAAGPGCLRRGGGA